MYLIETQYLAPISTFAVMHRAGGIMLEQFEHYQKQGLRNRAYIVGPQSPMMLSVPLQQGKNAGTLIREVKIAYDEPWQMKHWRALQAAYGKSAFWMHYSPVLEPFYTQQGYTYLWDLNQALLLKIISLLKLELNVQLSTDYIKQYEAASGIIDVRNRHRDTAVDYVQMVPYHQVFSDRIAFMPNLSILDLLFTFGPDSRRILEKMV